MSNKQAAKMDMLLLDLFKIRLGALILKTQEKHIQDFLSENQLTHYDIRIAGYMITYKGISPVDKSYVIGHSYKTILPENKHGEFERLINNYARSTQEIRQLQQYIAKLYHFCVNTARDSTEMAINMHHFIPSIIVTPYLPAVDAIPRAEVLEAFNDFYARYHKFHDRLKSLAFLGEML